MKNIRLLALIFAALICSVPSVYATDISLHGFGSIGMGKTMGADETFNVESARAAKYDSEYSYRPDTIFGLQMNADFGDGLSARIQTTARGVEDFEPTFEWAYLSYDLSDHTTVQVGRKRIPIFLYSDTLDVGYAYNWIRPPTDFYASLFNNYEGISMLYRRFLGDWFMTTQIGYGRNQDEAEIFAMFPNKRVDAKNIFSLDTQFALDWITLRLGYFSTNADSPKLSDDEILDITIIDFDGPAPGSAAPIDFLTGFTPEERANIVGQDIDFRFVSAGVSIDKNNILFTAEYADGDSSFSRVDPFQSWYVSLGVRLFDKLIPSLTYSYVEDDPDVHDLANRVTLDPSIPPELIGRAIGFQRGAFIGTDLKRSSIIASVRYDFHYAAALKFEYIQQENDVEGGEESDVFAIAIDFAF